MKPLARAATLLPPVAFRFDPGVAVSAVGRYLPQLLTGGGDAMKLTGPFSKAGPLCFGGPGGAALRAASLPGGRVASLWGWLIDWLRVWFGLGGVASSTVALNPHPAALATGPLLLRRSWTAPCRTPSSATG